MPVEFRFNFSNVRNRRFQRPAATHGCRRFNRLPYIDVGT
jgi:hypothetical protein